MNKKQFVAQAKAELMAELTYLMLRKKRLDEHEKLICKEIDSIEKKWDKTEKEIKEKVGCEKNRLTRVRKIEKFDKKKE